MLNFAAAKQKADASPSLGNRAKRTDMQTAQTTATAALFDLDGVVVNTEPQYSGFWHQMGVDFLGMPDLEGRIKGQTLDFIFDRFFHGMTAEQAAITDRLNRFERSMSFDYIPGVMPLLADLRTHGVRLAIVTSSNEEKMRTVRRVHPELWPAVDRVLTAEMFARSKPDPDCFLLGMRLLGSTPATTYVLEDSFNGLRAARASGGTVIGLATTNPAESIAPLADVVLSDFRCFGYREMMAIKR